MVFWQLTVKLGDLHSKFDAAELTISEVAVGLTERLKVIQQQVIDRCPKHVAQLDKIVAELANVATEEDYNNTLEKLYDWGDISLDNKAFDGKKLCWVDPF